MNGLPNIGEGGVRPVLETYSPPKIEAEHVLWFKVVGGKRFIVCRCGARKSHPRQAVLLRWIEKHQEKTGARWLNQEVEDLGS